MKKPRSKTWFRRAKSVGRDAENAVVEYLSARGIKAERRRLTGTEDCGDISNSLGATIEVKACKALDLSGWLAEVEAEGDNADKRYEEGVRHPRAVVAKKRGTLDAGEWYFICTLEQGVELLQAHAARAAGRIES